MSEPKSPEGMSPRELHHETRRKLQAAKEKASETAMVFSYMDEIMEAGEPYWDQIDDFSKIADIPTSGSAIDLLRNLYDVSDQAERQARLLADVGGTVSVATSAYVGTTVSSWSYNFHSPDRVIVADPDMQYEDVGIRYVDISPLREVADRPQKHKEYARRFAARDDELGETYQEIWEVLHKTIFPDKAASYLMRQSFDHLFRLLVTDQDEERIRQAPRRVPPDPSDPEVVSRAERLDYAADEWVSNPDTRKTLKASIRSMVDTYNTFNNILHRGKPLDHQITRSALFAMQKFLEEWADALGW